MKRLKVTLILALAVGLFAAGCSDDTPTVEIAAVLPLSGDLAVYGKSIQQGAELRAEQLAESGEFAFNLNLTVSDSGSDPAQAADLLTQSFSSAIAGIGGVSSDEAIAMVPSADAGDRVLLSPSASSPKLSGISGNFFRIFPAADVEAISMGNFLRDSLELSNLVLLTEESEYGTGAAEAFTEVWGADQLAGQVTFSAESDLAATVQEVLGYEPDSVYVASTGSGLVRVIQALRIGGYDQDNSWIATTSALASPSVLAEAGEAANRVLLTQGVFDTDSPDEPMASFVAAYEAKYGGKPDFYAGHGYDAVSVLANAAKEGGFAFPTDIRKGMRAIQNLTGVTGSIQFRESGDVQKFMRVYYVADGAPVDYEKYMKARRDEIMKKIQENQRRIESMNR